MKSRFLLTTSIAVLLAVPTGCTPLHYYSFTPDYADTARQRGGTPTTVSDEDVFLFGNRLKVLLRKRMNFARIMRESSTTLQVITAASAAALAATGGGATVVAALAGSSAVIPQVQGIFQTKERATAFNQGINLLGDAETEFLAETHGKLDNTQLTDAGIKYVNRINATLRLIEAALVSQIPDIRDMKIAHGEETSAPK